MRCRRVDLNFNSFLRCSSRICSRGSVEGFQKLLWSSMTDRKKHWEKNDFQTHLKSLLMKGCPFPGPMELVYAVPKLILLASTLLSVSLWLDYTSSPWVILKVSHTSRQQQRSTVKRSKDWGPYDTLNLLSFNILTLPTNENSFHRWEWDQTDSISLFFCSTLQFNTHQC